MGTRAITLLTVLTLAACGDRALVASTGGLRLTTDGVDFGQVWVGHSRSLQVGLRNEARGNRTARLTVSGPFTLRAAELEVPGGAAISFEVSLAAGVEGLIDGQLTLDDVSIPVTAFALTPPVCDTAAVCHQVAFDPVSGSCLDTLLADGTSCSGLACVENGQCQAGLCKGAAMTCDDANACTVDSCGIDGCVHAELACPAATDPCQVPRCDPATGCATEEAPDGTRCGPGDCTQAFVCMSGACVERPVPDGATCGEPTACADAPSCHQGACVPSAPKPLTELWSYVPAHGAQVSSFGSQDPKGNFYFLEYAGTSPTIQYALVSIARDGTLRFRVAVGEPGAWAARGPIDVANQQILIVTKSRTLEARSLVDGHLRWSVNYFDAMKPLFDRGAGATYNFSLSEITLLSGTVAAFNVHEDAGPWRSWVVGIHLATGQLAWNREHQGHLSSFVSNAKGELFYVGSEGWGGTFTLYGVDAVGAPLWTKALPPNQYASVLSLVDNALLFRGMNQWLDSATGNPLGALGTMEAGFLSVGDASTAWVVSTCSGTTCSDAVRAFDVKKHQSLWQLPVGEGVNELLLASRGVVLAITSPKNVYPQLSSTLVALDPMGVEAFRCKTSEALDPTAVLDDGQLVGRLGNRIAALALPKMSPAPSGWISSRGSYLRTGRAR